jgi:hypothetical protein
MFGPELNPDLAATDALLPSLRHVTMGLPRDHPE